MEIVEMFVVSKKQPLCVSDVEAVFKTLKGAKSYIGDSDELKVFYVHNKQLFETLETLYKGEEITCPTSKRDKTSQSQKRKGAKHHGKKQIHKRNHTDWRGIFC